jgi:hypothetical protein
MSLEVVSVSHTGTSQTSVPVNSHFIITFNKPIRESDYYPDPGSKFKLFKIPENTQVGLKAGIVPGTPHVIYIKPLINLQENATFQLVIIGRSNGIRSTDNDFLVSNHITQFTTNADAPFQSVTIENGVVTINEPPPPRPITPEVPEEPTYVDRNNLATTEETLSDFYYDDEVGGNINRVRIIASTPKNYSIWNQNIERIRTRWDRNIALIETGEVSVRKLSLPFETGIGPELNIPIHRIDVNGNIIDVYINETGTNGNFPSTNKEYILSFPEGSVVDIRNTLIYNTDETIRFTGQMWPMFATPDQVISRLAAFDPALADSLDKYEIAKMIHQLSIYVSSELQGRELTPDLLFWVAQYIICRIAYELAIGPLGIVKTMTNRTILGQSASFKVVGDKSIDNPLKECMTKAAIELDILKSSVAANITVKSSGTVNYPGRDYQHAAGYEIEAKKAMGYLGVIEALMLEKDNV